jgi:UDP-GlcNAc:undecaprenyl-phosphate GlcNAc-1-phosphate transferase
MPVFIILITFISAIITFFATPRVIILAKKYKLVDNPKVRPHPAHTHKGIIPRGGGLAIFLGIFLPIFFLFPPTKTIIGIFLGGMLLILVGLWDDKKDRSPYIRFVFNSLAAIFAISLGVNIPYITNPLGGVIHLDAFWANLVAFLWIVWTTNIIGWSGGVDGQLPGFVAISSFIIGLLSLRFAATDPNQLHVTFLSFATAGAFLGFLPWNFYPQKIMPGYGGKTLAGYILAILSILSFSKLGTALLVLAVPMTDASFMFMKRILSGKSPVWATSGHLHHHLLALGWGRRRIAIFYWIISGIAGIAALILNSKQKIFALVAILVLVIGFILGINFLFNLAKKRGTERY